jgi:hypothetical protein
VPPDRLVAYECREDPYERHRRRDVSFAGALELPLERLQGRNLQRRGDVAPRGQATAERRSPLAQISHLRRVVGRSVKRGLTRLVVAKCQVEPVAELQHWRLGHLLLLVRDVLAFARLAHPVALDRLGEDDGRLPGVLRRHQIARCPPEMIETDLVQGRRRLVARDMPPSSDDSRFACSTIAIAFQRTNERKRRSSP